MPNPTLRDIRFQIIVEIINQDPKLKDRLRVYLD